MVRTLILRENIFRGEKRGEKRTISDADIVGERVSKWLKTSEGIGALVDTSTQFYNTTVTNVMEKIRNGHTEIMEPMPNINGRRIDLYVKIEKISMIGLIDSETKILLQSRRYPGSVDLLRIPEFGERLPNIIRQLVSEILAPKDAGTGTTRKKLSILFG